MKHLHQRLLTEVRAICLVSCSQTVFFPLCVGGEKGSGKHSIALLF